jgi:hypothetical protein
MNPTGLDRVAAVNQNILQTGGVAPSAMPVAPANPHDAAGYNPATDPTSSVSRAITPQSLAPVTSVQIPTITPNTASAGIIASTQPTPLQQATDTVNSEFTGINQAQNAKQGIVDQIKELFGQESDLQTNQQNSPEMLKAQQAQADLADINDKIAKQQVALRGEQDSINSRGDISASAQQGLLNNVNDTYGRRLADLAILQSAARGNVTDYTTAAEKALQMKLAPIQTQIDYLTKYASANADQLTQDQKDKLNAVIAEKKSLADKTTADSKTLNDVVTKAMDSGIRIPTATLAKMQADPANAAAIAARDGVILVNPLDTEYKQAQIRSLNATAASKSPNPVQPTVHTVTADEANGGLYQVAQNNGYDFEALKAANPQLGADFKIIPGTVINVPGSGAASYSTIDISRYGRAANSIVKNYIALPQYSLVANAFPYLQRIQAADTNPGSVSDADLLDSLVKVNTGGGQVTEAQVKLITDGKSYGDALNVWKNKLNNGGVLSDSQRQQLTALASAVFDKYKAGYQPVYDQVTSQLEGAGIPKPFWAIPDLNSLDSQDKGAIQGGGVTKTIVPPEQIPAGYYQASDGLFYKK